MGWGGERRRGSLESTGVARGCSSVTPSGRTAHGPGSCDTTGLPLAFVPVVGAVLIGARGQYALGTAVPVAAVAMLVLAVRLREVRRSGREEVIVPTS